MSRNRFIVAAILVAALAQITFAAPITFDRNLGATQSIIHITGAIVPGTGSYISGDSFVMPANPYGSWLIDSIKLYTVASTPTTSSLASEFSMLWLFTGDYNVNGVAPNSVAGPMILSVPNPNVSFATAGSFLQGADSYPIWAVTFSNLNWLVSAGETLYAGMWGYGGRPNPGGAGTTNWGLWYNLYRSGGFTDSLGADGLYEVFSGDVADWGALPYDNSGNTGFGDLNMQVTAEAVPEPGTLSLFALGGLALVALRRRLHG